MLPEQLSRGVGTAPRDTHDVFNEIYWCASLCGTSTLYSQSVVHDVVCASSFNPAGVMESKTMSIPFGVSAYNFGTVSTVRVFCHKIPKGFLAYFRPRVFTPSCSHRCHVYDRNLVHTKIPRFCVPKERPMSWPSPSNVSQRNNNDQGDVEFMYRSSRVYVQL